MNYLRNTKESKAIIIIGPVRLIKDCTVTKVKENLKEVNIETRIFSGVENDSLVATVRKGRI